mmetsp:Transcript_122715/g.199563  ORF Transcript_122715/g.199563 Transcript_122715/m.199563 type:complete len:86 (-) Transcript_122715:1898-2155(-)
MDKGMQVCSDSDPHALINRASSDNLRGRLYRFVFPYMLPGKAQVEFCVVAEPRDNEAIDYVRVQAAIHHVAIDLQVVESFDEPPF